MHSSCVVITLFNTDLCKSAFSTYSFKKLVFPLSVFHLFCLFCFELNVIFGDILCNMCVIIVYTGAK